MSTNCFGIYLIKNSHEEFIYDVNKITLLFRSRVKEFMYASVKEILKRISSDICEIYHIDIGLDNVPLTVPNGISLVGIKIGEDACLIFTTEAQPHHHLIQLARYIIQNGLLGTVEENFSYIRTEEKIRDINKELSEVKTIMINNIDNILANGEKIEDIIKRTEYLVDSSKEFVIISKKLNKCCQII